MPKQRRRTAHDFLRWLLDSGPVSKRITFQMAEAEGISSDRIDKAIERLGITFKKRPTGVVLVLPGHEEPTELML